ncbi:hypothetical protein L218DRAFT_553400 [Marasmius fiardii PR-910]|nr:hypothetical protein L218DRAFT_553400 [Marasmius fiardii PR-910]
MNKEVLETKILSLKRVTSRDSGQQEYKTQAERKWHRNWLSSPSFQLPDDVLVLIFDLCAVDEANLTHSSLWSVSQTCQRWRAVALSQPSLWRRIKIEHLDVDDPIPMFRTWIERSCSAPLIIDVSLGDVIEEEEMELVMKMLVDECHWWRDVDIYLNFEVYYWLAAKGCSFPVLRNLDIRVEPTNNWLDANENWPPLDGRGFSDAPKLSKVILPDGIDGDFEHLPIIALPWHQLKHYTCSYFADAEFFDIADQFCNVEKLNLIDMYRLSPSCVL